MFDKDRFHNQLALNLGYQRIVNDKRINISIDEKWFSDDVMVSISIDGLSKPICYKASEGLSLNEMDCLDENGYDDIKIIVDAVQKAYIKAATNPLWNIVRRYKKMFKMEGRVRRSHKIKVSQWCPPPPLY